MAGLPHGARELVTNATHQRFLTGLNTILVIGAVLAFAGAVVAAWLVREEEIERAAPELIPGAAIAEAR